MVTGSPVSWPIGFLLLVLCVATLTIFVPWIIPSRHRNVLFCFVGAVLASFVWALYEFRLQAVTAPTDPLIRVDLFLIIPLIAIDWMSAAVAVIIQQLPRQHAKEITNETL